MRDFLLGRSIIKLYYSQKVMITIAPKNINTVPVTVNMINTSILNTQRITKLAPERSGKNGEITDNTFTSF